jgi:hypothetical protein
MIAADALSSEVDHILNFFLMDASDNRLSMVFEETKMSIGPKSGEKSETEIAKKRASYDQLRKSGENPRKSMGFKQSTSVEVKPIPENGSKDSSPESEENPGLKPKPKLSPRTFSPKRLSPETSPVMISIENSLKTEKQEPDLKKVDSLRKFEPGLGQY